MINQELKFEFNAKSLRKANIFLKLGNYASKVCHFIAKSEKKSRNAKA